MATLTERFLDMIEEPDLDNLRDIKIFRMIDSAPANGEREGLLALLYHEGIGVEVNLDKCFELAENAAFEFGDPLGYYLLGYLCDNAETPDQAEGGPRQKYDHYDAERFYEKCAESDGHWGEQAHLWLGDYFLDSAKGGDPEIAVEHYEAIAEHNADAAAALSDYYWDLIMPDYIRDEEWEAQLFKWTEKAAELDPEEFSYRMGWIYADALGCEFSMEKAVEYFKQAYLSGDWRGPKAIARLYSYYLEEHPEYFEEHPEMPGKETLLKEIVEWTRIGDEMYATYLAENPSEADPSQEED